jgi:GGDEF domain-containing protein
MSLCSTDEFKSKKREAETEKTIDIEKIINEMTAKADIALYESKKLGRNMVTGYPK